MLTRASSVLYAAGLITAAGFGTASFTASSRPTSSPAPSPRVLVAHEWGTFTTVAGTDGRAIDWLPLGGPTDLPCFVEHYDNRPTVKIVADAQGPFDYQRARTALLGKVRMETPVLYFYAGQDTLVDVKVRFPHGLMTEWYPHADVMEVINGPTTLEQNATATLEWKNVRVAARAAGAFPTTAGESHYYAARATDAAPLVVGAQQERFLFYRGVADFDVPISAAALPNGRVRIAPAGAAGVPAVVLFERRGASLGFRVIGTVHGDTTVDAPKLDGSLPALREQLARSLTDAGLYTKEAAAMLETWRDSWFEDGVRVFYVLPQKKVDAILPLEIHPAPERVTRVFVGRMEVVTQATEAAVDQALAKNDASVLARYARFLGPITDRLLAKTPTAAEQAKIRSATNAALAAYLRRSTVCE
ncbi:MAG: hypothetical protein ACREPM_15150 [Gemmatimonadaceae bacterium]